MVAVIVGLNVLGWVMLAAAVGGHYHITGTQIFGFGTGILAYTLGMRHAFDADHIAAIDNTTRKLVKDGKRPLSVGFFFSLGHSTIVFALAVLLNFGIRALDSAVRTTAPGCTTHRDHRHHRVRHLLVPDRRAEPHRPGLDRQGVPRDAPRHYSDEELERQLDNRGLMNRFFGGYASGSTRPGRCTRSACCSALASTPPPKSRCSCWPGTAVVGGLPFYAILSLPILFAAGMCLFDTADGCFMNFAYDWAFARPVRKVFYNLTITGLSVFVAFFIGTIEILGLIGQEYNLTGGFWSFMANFDINKAGFVIVGIFVLTWAIALSIWRFGHIEQRWDVAAAKASAQD